MMKNKIFNKAKGIGATKIFFDDRASVKKFL